MRGFTLIETIIYIALLGFLMTGVLLSVYGIVESGSITQKKTATQDEGNFVIRKIEWALGSAKSVSLSGSSLLVGRTDGNVVFDISADGDITMNGNRLTSDAVEVNNLDFQLLTPAGVEATVTLDDVVFTTRRYLRQ